MSVKPKWLCQKAPNSEVLETMGKLLKELSLNTVCASADCPNIGKCFENRTATFMIMGDICSRSCRFCSVGKGKVMPLDPNEPTHVAMASKHLNLEHVVITSVTRDDLDDGGAGHFSKIVRE